MASEIAEKILVALSMAAPSKMIAREISNSTGIQKSAVNAALYALLKTGVVSKTDGTPPMWTLSGDPPPAVTSTFEGRRDVVMVDLGNVHDCLKELVPYAERGDCVVYGFADRAFNGYGVTPKPPPCIEVYQADSTHRNAADIALIWKVATLVQSPSAPTDFYVATKDQGFQSLADYVGAEDTLTFVTNWAELRNHIE